MKLIVVSAETIFEGETAIVNQLFENGLNRFHLRKPGLSFNEQKDWLTEIKSEYLNRIVLHDHYELMHHFPVKGIHVNARSGDTLKGLSKSCHSLEELTSLQDFEYVFLSPIFDSISKQGYTAQFEMDKLNTELNKEHSFEVIALGGIDANNIDTCRSIGFDGVAVLGAVWKSGNPLEAFLTIKEKCQKNVNTY